MAIAATGTATARSRWRTRPGRPRCPGDRELSLAPGQLRPGRGRRRGPGRPHGPAHPVVRARLPGTVPGCPSSSRPPPPDRLDLDVGDTLEIPLDGTYERLRTRVTEVVPAVPGAPEESAVLVDLHAVHQARLHDQEVVSPPTDLWVGTAQPERRPESCATCCRPTARIDTATDAAGRTVLATAALAWWLGAAGCGLLALLTLVTVGRGQLRSRRGDIAMLRALGLSVREQQVLRGRELAWTDSLRPASPALVAGVAVAVLVVPQLARAAVPEPYPTIATGLGRAHARPARRCRRAGGSAGRRRDRTRGGSASRPAALVGPVGDR